ncbi:MAG TPA: nickel-responsive transcriptional regulator NikR [Tepidisphaeraceae bacterium]|jgi:CopG family nickel-responsive transcriptional regulator|nr:nickel-responsive transcriptional regulator NikR [Tepidisphaeraceae bacterium]
MKKPSRLPKSNRNVTSNNNRNTTPKSPQLATRFSVSLPEDLLRDLDDMVQQRNHANRSQAIADMIRDRLVEHRQTFGDQEMAGTITLIYDHHTPRIQSTLTAVQHDYPHSVVSNLHVHLDHDNCLEVIVLRGQGSLIKTISDRLLTAKGVKHGKLTITAAGSSTPQSLLFTPHRHH